ncbi:hypothetical protein BP5796_11569 [Coleophoma crateriformis]|uniref:Major facilitator superfamily (MFS) profile domain-containing protein n=1 Tax=Coleophoma crateriformis TaxID=565419 RepID=A0A3D8QIV7_9HELO|nr:hypothetical protein BP5796_11569 [Coleophoma crateriformis]
MSQVDSVNKLEKLCDGPVNAVDSVSIAEGSMEVDQLALDVVNAETEYTEAQYRKLRRKIDLRLLPVMWLCYGTQQADKTGLSAQAIFGLQEDTGLKGQEYAWLTTAFYLAYLVAEGPGNYVLQRAHMGWFLALVMSTWAIIVLCTGFTQNFAGLVSLRVLQGAAECTISPTFLLITGMYYTSTEHTFRSIIWGTSSAGMKIIASLIEYGIGMYSEAHPGHLQPWRGISFFLGGLTFLCTILVFFMLGSPREVRWLSEDEKRMAMARVVGNQTGSDRHKRGEWKWDQVRGAFKDPQTYFFFILSIVNALPVGGNNAFGNLVYKSFGFTSLETLLEGDVPQQAVSIIFFLVVGYTNMKYPSLRIYSMIVSLIPAFIGMMVLAFIPRTSGHLWLLWGMYLMTVTGNLPGLLIWTMLPSNIAGRTKKSVVGTMLFIGYCTGNSIAPQMFQSSAAPKYISGLTACAILYGLEILIMISWRCYYVWINKKRDRQVAAMGLTADERERQGHLNAEMDKTDTENIHFRYSF